MNRLYTVLLILLAVLNTRSIQAQCPTPLVNAPDSACKGSPVLFTNASIGSNLKYEWDFKSGDLNYSPPGGLTATLPNDIATSTGVDYMKEGNNFIGFNLKSFASLVRLEFGNSLSNVPTVTNLGDLGGVIGAGNLDFKLFVENGEYYALLNTAFGQVTRLYFGNSLLNTPTATSVTIPSGLFVTAFNMDVQRMGNDVVALIANISGGNVTVINFGPSITNNTPNAYNIAVPGANPITTALVNDCGHLYAFVGHVSASPFSIIDFGTSVTSTPVQILNFNYTTNYAYKKIHVINEGGNWMLVGNTYGGELLHTFFLGKNVSNTNPLFVNHGSVGAFGSAFWTFAIRNIESEIGGFACNYNTGELTWFKFPQLGAATPAFTYDENPYVTYNNPGTYVYSLTITDTITGLSSSYMDSLYISEAPTASFTNGAGCTGAPTEFISTSTGGATQFNWDFGSSQTGNGDTITNIYANSGNYQVTLITINDAGCSDTITNPISVNEAPNADFLFVNNQCAGANVTFTDNSTTATGNINSWDWFFSPTDSASGFQSTFSYTSDGQFPVTLYVEASTGCRDTIIKNIDIIPGPIAEFSVTNTCLGDTAQFANGTSITGGLNVNYTWLLTATDTSYLENPQFNFPGGIAGDYPVRLTATATNGCEDTLTKIIHIGTPANVYFSLDDDTVCSDTYVLFTDSSTIAGGETITGRYWDFGDSQTDSIATSISHLYNNAGAYTLTLTIQTAENCLASYSRILNVIESPLADFSYNNVCRGATAALTDLSTSSSLTTLTSWNWNFGDTTTSTVQNPSHVYSDSGSYTITLVAIDNNGCYDSTQKTIQIYPTPEVYFTNSKACTNNEIHFTDSTTIQGTTIVNWEWNFGDGNSSNGIANPTNIFQLSAAYPVTLVSTSAQGCKDSLTKFIAVDYSPEYQLNSSTACYGSPNVFSFSYTGNVISNPGYIWNFGDSTSSLQGQPTHTYATSGTKTVIFTLTNINNGCAITDTITAVVLTNPTAQFISDSVCLGQTLQLTDISQSPDDPISQWNWSSALNLNSSSQNQSLITTSTGTFPVKLTVSTNFGCKDSIIENAKVFSLPNTSFVPDPDFGSPPLIVNFDNTSDPGSYQWNFGDGSTNSNSQNPSHTFADTGAYTTTLITTSPEGCIDSSSHTIYVLLPYIDISIESSKITETASAFEVSAQLRNLGNITINNFRINANLQGKSPVAEYIQNINLEPGQTVDFTLNTKFLKDQFKPEFLCLEITEVNQGRDAIANNNKSCTTLENTDNIFSAYPNPNSGTFILPLYFTKDSELSIEIHDTYGKEVRAVQTYQLQEGFHRIEMNLTDLASGSYILTIIKGEEQTFQRIVKR